MSNPRDCLWCFDTDTHILFGPNTQTSLPPKHGDVLVHLAANQHRFVSIQELHEAVWRDRVVSDAAVRKVLVELKRLMKADDDSDIIENRRALGYRINLPLALKITRCCDDGETRSEVSLSENNIDADTVRQLIKQQRRLVAEHEKTLDLLEQLLKEREA